MLFDFSWATTPQEPRLPQPSSLFQSVTSCCQQPVAVHYSPVLSIQSTGTCVFQRALQLACLSQLFYQSSQTCCLSKHEPIACRNFDLKFQATLRLQKNFLHHLTRSTRNSRLFLGSNLLWAFEIAWCLADPKFAS